MAAENQAGFRFRQVSVAVYFLYLKWHWNPLDELAAVMYHKWIYLIYWK